MGGSPISSTQKLQRTEDMTPITRQDILSHQTVVPWAAQYQIEQDLLLCRAMVALFEDRFLHGQIAMRGASIREGHFSPNTRRVSRSMPSS